MRRPRFIAEHARNARGLLGRVIAFIMAHETWGQNLRVMDVLGIDESDHILLCALRREPSSEKMCDDDGFEVVTRLG